MRVIRKLTVLCGNSARTFEVGNVINGLTVAKITNNGVEYEDRIHSEYQVLDANGELIANVENVPIIVDWQENEK